MPALLALILLAALPLAHAAVFKCAADPAGVVYQDVPCKPGKELRNFDSDPPPVSILPDASAARSAVQAKPERPLADRRAAKEVKDPKAAARKFIATGMSEAEVIQRIGEPEVDSLGGRAKAKQWSYLPTSGDPDVITTLTIVSGKVVNVERKLVH